MKIRVLAVVALLLAACTTAGREDYASLEPSQRRLLEQRRLPPAAESPTTPSVHPIVAALAESRRRVVPWILGATRGSDGTDASLRTPSERTVAVTEAPERSPDDESIALRLRGMPLAEVIDFLGERLRLNILVPEGLVAPVTVNFPEMPVQRALDLILAEHGYRLVARDGAHFVTARETTAQPERRSFPLRSGITLDPTHIQALLTPGVGTFQLDPKGGVLSVSDHPAALDQVSSWLALVDQRPPQVLIEAVIMEIQRDDGDELGVRIDVSNITVGDATAAVGSSLLPGVAGPFNFQVLSDDQEVLFQLVASQRVHRTNVLSNPLLATVSGQTANLEVIERIPYIDSENSVDTGTGGVTQSFSNVEFEEVGIKLEVTPTAGKDGIIEMQITPEVLELTDFLVGTPVIDRRKVKTSVYVRNNETLMIGGLLREGRIRTVEKVPFLGDIPLLGALFRHDNDRREKTELLIFLTPHLIGAGSESLDGFHPQTHYLDREQRFPRLNEALREKGLRTDTAPR